MNRTGRLYDISQTLSPDMPVWPGDTRFAAEPVWSHGPECPVAVARLTLSPHSGTHADAPRHHHPAGAAIDKVDLAPYLGRARVIDLAGHRGEVLPVHLEAAVDDGVERVLLRTFDRFPRDRWRADFAVLTGRTIAWLAARGVLLIGVDAPSIDPQTSKTMEAHLAVHAAGLRILEGLVLDDVVAGDYELIALPLKMAEIDASPVRAILRSYAS